jgi:hypothetical protein
MSKEQQELLDEAYEKYHQENKHVMYLTFLLEEEFINKCKTDTEFSEKWGLKIDERELSLEERETLLLEIDDTFRTSTTQEIKLVLDEYNIPTKLITITYQDQKTESYEN